MRGRHELLRRGITLIELLVVTAIIAILIGAFGHRYLKRASWRSRDQFLDHVNVSWPEYNRLYAHPFEWYWTNHMMRQWFANHAQE